MTTEQDRTVPDASVVEAPVDSPAASARKIYGLDALRLVALGFILVYHFAPKILPAGFFGVNVFFVLSGFLMTHHALEEIKETGHFSLSTFYAKRAKRLLPDFLLLLIMGVLLVNVAEPDLRVGIDRQTAAAFSSLTNWFEILSGGSYEAQFTPHIFVHTWFLAVEIHFYLLWPLFLMALLRWANKKGKDVEQFVLVSSGVLYLVSFGLLLYGQLDFSNRLSWMYFSDCTRFSSFFVGAMLAVYRKRIQKVYIYLPQLSVVGFLVLGALSFVLSYANRWTYLVGFFVADFLTAFLIWNYGNETVRVDSARLRKAASFSYDIYLLHWPLLVMSRKSLGSFKGALFALCCTAALLFLRYRYLSRVKSLPAIALPDEASPIKEKGKALWRRLLAFPTSLLTGCAVLTMVTAVTAWNAPDMLSLQQSIWEKSVKQDLGKIQNDVDQLLAQRKTVQDALQSDSGAKDEDLQKLDNKGITIIGDSVLLGPREFLMANLPKTFVDAEGERLAEKGAEVIQEMKADGKLGNYVVIALGANAIENRENSLRKMAEAVPAGTRMIFVTPYSGEVDHHAGGVAMKNVAKEFPFITIMDWEGYAKKHPDLYQNTDGIHFYGLMDTYKAYLAKLKAALLEASMTPAKK